MMVKNVDSKGRITLKKSLAGSTMLVEEKDGTLILRPAVTIPASQAWLWKNKKALAMVMQGLEQARKRQFVPGPDLAADAKLAARMKGD